MAQRIPSLCATSQRAAFQAHVAGAAGKATLVGLMGAERARLQAERLVAQAKAHLDGFTERVDHLRMLADFTIQRRS